QMSVKIIDSLNELGGQLVTLYPEKYVYDVAGFPKVLAKDLANNLIEQGLQYRATPCLGEQVRTLEFDESRKVFGLHTSKSVHKTRAILIAAGVGSFTPKMLTLPMVEQFEGKGLHYFVRQVDVCK